MSDLLHGCEAALAWGGFHLFGDRKSIDEAKRLMHEAERCELIRAEVLRLRAEVKAREQAAELRGFEEAIDFVRRELRELPGVPAFMRNELARRRTQGRA